MCFIDDFPSVVVIKYITVIIPVSDWIALPVIALTPVVCSPLEPYDGEHEAV